MTAAAQKPDKILVVEVGGTHVKVRVTGQREERKIPSISAMKATRMVRDAARVLGIVAVSLSLPGGLHAQEATDPKVPQPQQQPAAASAPAPDEGRPVSFRQLVPNILSDQKRIWLFPTQVVRGRHLAPTLAVISFTAALIATDARAGRYFRRSDTYNGFNSKFTSTVTGVGVVIAPVGLYVAGILTKDRYARRTALLAGEALADGEILGAIMKDVGRRKRPQDFAANENMTGSWFAQTNGVLKGIGSFPSEHSVAVFAVATVISRRYPRHKWVPYVAYGLSSLVGFSRLTTSAHFPSDVFMGAVLGYGIARLAVLRQ